MPLRLKEDPKEWRKSVLLAALGLAIVSSLLRWRRVLSPPNWSAILVVLAAVSVIACLRPGWFRGFYRLSTRCGFFLSEILARCVLILLFVFVMIPVGLLFRLLGKDPLRLKRTPGANSYWSTARPTSPLDRMF
jgi:hypothetical protein